MKIQRTHNDIFISVTTRKANYVDQYFGKITAWPTKEAYDAGDCTRFATWDNVYLGDNPKEFNAYIDKFIRDIPCTVIVTK